MSEPINDRSGSRNKVALRLPDSNSAAALVAWRKANDPVRAASETTSAIKSFETRHKHLIGGCSGRLILDGDRLVFESVSDLDHSRRWVLQDIKELKRSNPYRFKVVPFTGDSFDFEMLGTGMGNDDYKSLVDRVTRARSRR